MNTFTNAMHNRKQAIRLFKAGYSPENICNFFPEVFYLNEGKLGQIYDYTLPDGRKETSISVSSIHVDKLIEKIS